jgi:3'-phosphoadenosine 5'-phosphosulfate sulfotransferase (PAPS reductase)/FAD synthetase
MNIGELKMAQALPLELKIAKTERRLDEAVYQFTTNGLYTSISGGKDSSVLHHIVKNRYPDIPSVFCNTTLEYREVIDKAKEIADEVIRPDMNYAQTITHYGYPCISKSQAMAFRKLTTQNLSSAYRNKLLHGDEKGRAGKLSDKWHYLLNSADFKISEKCCDVMKKRPFKKYNKKTGRIPITGVMADESQNRQIRYLNNGGCNAFNCSEPKSNPLGFWTEQDILQYIYEYKLDIAEVYGEVVYDNNEKKFKTTGEKRTGCVGCIFGCHMEKGKNRFQRMKESHPEMYDYCMRGGTYNDEGIWVPEKGLGMAHVLDKLNIEYR